MPVDKCPDCGYALSIHFRSSTAGARAGEYLGCPKIIASRFGREETHPRIAVRVLVSGEHKGNVIVLWADYIDDDGAVLIWDLSAGSQYVADQTGIRTKSRRATRDQEHEAVAEVEHQIGGAVRLVRSAHAPRKP